MSYIVGIGYSRHCIAQRSSAAESSNPSMARTGGAAGPRGSRFAARERMTAMPEATTQAKAKAKAAFDTPKFDLPKFDLPKIEVPAAFRELAEKGVSQAKENYEKLKAAAEETTDLMEETYATASKGAADYGLMLLEAARFNTNAAFDFYSELIGAKSFSEAIDLSTAHARKQFEAVTAQSKDLAALATKVATEAAEPFKNGVSNALRKVA
jgi:phasin